ncbi:FCS-Like Zinc finger 8-like [Abrus precatorius]|uniref:FCS-Like Zinc finger 8-like n=1 Tax=Abrus precatorius TaxID=3816 RepID=A0A8B8L8D0_ABRPR|nr:FCS-Like Zinc finger 8-like [Abrus precatorius]
MLLRNRSRAVTKPGLMADHSSQQSQNQNYTRTIPSLFGSPKFRDFTNKCLSGTEALRSPTSILETRPLSPFGFGIPFSYDNKTQTVPHSQNRSSRDKPDSKAIGLALVGNLKDGDPVGDNSSKPNKGNVLFGTQLRVKIPFESQPCATDFGTNKTKDSKNSGLYAKDSPSMEILSWSEMELSEEYTCVISHGPNPRTTHIFNNCIVESYCSLPQNSLSDASANFLSFCYTCKKHLEQTKDIFIYRGEKAFCSRECRHQEMVLDGIDNLEFESNGYS